MSENFYIKKTAFDNNGTSSEREQNSFIIGAGELNGPAGIARNSDLELYGFGSLRWGEGIDQNFYRLLENFACPRKENGDYYPGGSPEVYDDTIHPVVPKDEDDLGTGNGISMPLKGQPWYDTTSDTLFMYDGTYWVSVGIEPGTIRIDAKSTISINDLECNGQSVNKNKYPALFSKIGYTYGGSGDNFSVPTIASLGGTSPETLIYVIRT